jgi:hypothetical protein
VPTSGKETPTQDFIFHGPLAFTAVDEKRMKAWFLRVPLNDFSQMKTYFSINIFMKKGNKNKELTTIILFVWLAFQ